MVHLRDGYVELRPQPAGDGLHHVSLLLERAAPWDTEIERGQRDQHASPSPGGARAYKDRATSRTSYASMTSPSLTSWKFSRPMPHSNPSWTSRTSSLNRRSEPTRPSYTTTPSRT